MSETRAPYLTLVVGRAGVSAGDGDAGEAQVPAEVPAVSASAAMGAAIMQACLAWVALIREDAAAIARVDVTPLGGGIYEAACVRSDGGGFPVLLRVSLVVEPGFVVRTVVEPMRPR